MPFIWEKSTLVVLDISELTKFDSVRLEVDATVSEVVMSELALEVESSEERFKDDAFSDEFAGFLGLEELFFMGFEEVGFEFELVCIIFELLSIISELMLELSMKEVV